MLALRHLSKDADFSDWLDEMIKQQVSIHVRSTYVHNKIQELGTGGFNLSLEDFVKAVAAFERNEVEQDQMASGDFSETAAGKISTYRSAKQNCDLETIGVKNQPRSDNGGRKSSGKSQSCGYCGHVHTLGSCPVRGKECQACGRQMSGSGEDKMDYEPGLTAEDVQGMVGAISPRDAMASSKRTAVWL